MELNWNKIGTELEQNRNGIAAGLKLHCSRIRDKSEQSRIKGKSKQNRRGIRTKSESNFSGIRK